MLMSGRNVIMNADVHPVSTYSGLNIGEGSGLLPDGHAVHPLRQECGQGDARPGLFLFQN